MCNNFSTYTPHTLDATVSCYKGVIINNISPLIFYERQHFNQSCVPSLACMWEGVCSLRTTSTPSGRQGFVCVYCSEIFSHSHQALWVFRKFARFSREKQVFQMSIDADLKMTHRHRQRTYVKKPPGDICKSISGTDLFTKSVRPVGWIENVIYNTSTALGTKRSRKSLHIQPQTWSEVHTLAEQEEPFWGSCCTVISARQSRYASPFGLLFLTQQSATYLVSSA